MPAETITIATHIGREILCCIDRPCVRNTFRGNFILWDSMQGIIIHNHSAVDWVRKL